MEIFRGAVAAAIMLIAGCATDSTHQLPAGQKLQITQAVLDYYKTYRQEVGNYRGAFAVSDDSNIAAYSVCPGTRCVPAPTNEEQALQLCESKGKTCILFARNRDIVVEYELLN